MPLPPPGLQCFFLYMILGPTGAWNAIYYYCAIMLRAVHQTQCPHSAAGCCFVAVIFVHKPSLSYSPPLLRYIGQAAALLLLLPRKKRRLDSQPSNTISSSRKKKHHLLNYQKEKKKNSNPKNPTMERIKNAVRRCSVTSTSSDSKQQADFCPRKADDDATYIVEELVSEITLSLLDKSDISSSSSQYLEMKSLISAKIKPAVYVLPTPPLHCSQGSYIYQN